MPFEPLRFVHAANVFLDRPLWVPVAVPAEVRETVEDATLIAFRNLVQNCIERQADFLLLTGNTFVEADRSMAARTALRSGFRGLDEAGIGVYVAPGLADPDEAWRAVPHLPPNVTFFAEDDGDPVAVFRDGRVVASIGPVGNPSPDRAARGSEASESRGAFRIGLCSIDARGRRSRDLFASHYAEAPHTPEQAGHVHTAELAAELERSQVDYLALGGPSGRTLLRTDAGLIHHPGAPQGLSPAETGPRACTLVEVDGREDVKCTSLPTAPVRFKTIKLNVVDARSEDDLLQQMCSSLQGRAAQPCERVLVVAWRCSGAGSAFEELNDPARCSALCRSLPETLAEGAVRLIHTIALESRPPDDGDAPVPGTIQAAVDEEIARLAESASSNVPDWVAGHATAPHWADRAGALARGISSTEVVDRARRLSAQRLNAAEGPPE